MVQCNVRLAHFSLKEESVFKAGGDPVHLELHKLGTNVELDESLLSVIAHIVFQESGCVFCMEQLS